MATEQSFCKIQYLFRIKIVINPPEKEDFRATSSTNKEHLPKKRKKKGKLTATGERPKTVL
jgi:hypothetical protein